MLDRLAFINEDPSTCKPPEVPVDRAAAPAASAAARPAAAARRRRTTSPSPVAA